MLQKNYLATIKQKWGDLHKKPGVFKYNLNVVSQKRLQGKCDYYVELNPDRTNLRRTPQFIPSLFSPFDHNKFNFTKINPSEKLMEVPFEDIVVSLIINQSPLTAYHSLICPALDDCQPQLITKKGLEFCIQFLLSMSEKSFRIGYNSPGALASVNHLHFHLISLSDNLYIDNVALEPIGKSGAYRLHNSMPTEAICFLIDEQNIQSIVKVIYDMIVFMCNHAIPHNLFMTPDRSEDSRNLKRIRVFVFAREHHHNVKYTTEVNTGFCELGGFITVGDSEIYANLTEEAILEKVKSTSGNVYTLLYKYLNEL